MGVQELPRSSSSLSMRTDASGHGEHASSDSFYDSDNTEAEASPAPQTATTKPAPIGKKFNHSIQSKAIFIHLYSMLTHHYYHI